MSAVKGKGRTPENYPKIMDLIYGIGFLTKINRIYHCTVSDVISIWLDKLILNKNVSGLKMLAEMIAGCFQQITSKGTNKDSPFPQAKVIPIFMIL
ncbi:26426_t:CDS:2, partial [Gigaspora margarita]